MADSLKELFETTKKPPTPSLSDLFRDKGAMPPAAMAPETRQYIKAELPSADPDKDCAPMAGGTVATPALNNLLTRLKAVSPNLQDAINHAQSANVTLCDISDTKQSFNGMHSFEHHLVAIDTDSATPYRTAAEEFVHTYQNHPRLSLQDYTLPDFNLWKFGIEAQAKLSVAVEAVRAKYAGDTTLFDDHLQGIHRDVAKYLDQQVQANGIGALENPEVLRNGFYMFMKSSEFTASNIARAVPGGPGLDKSVGAKTISIGDFTSQFGTIVGDDPRNNFLDGALTSKEDLVSMFGSSTRLAFKFQNNALPETTAPDKAATPLPGHD